MEPHYHIPCSVVKKFMIKCIKNKRNQRREELTIGHYQRDDEPMLETL